MPAKMNFDVEEKFIIDNYGKMKKKDVIYSLINDFKMNRSTAYHLLYKVIEGSKEKMYERHNFNFKNDLIDKLNRMEDREQKEYEEKQKMLQQNRPKIIIKF